MSVASQSRILSKRPSSEGGMSFKPEDSTDHESDSDSEVPKLSPVKVRFGIPLQAQDAELGTESFVSLDGQILILKRPEENTTSVLPAEDPPRRPSHTPCSRSFSRCTRRSPRIPRQVSVAS